MDGECIETRCPRIAGPAAEIAKSLLDAGVRLELVDADKRTDETVVIWREPDDAAAEPPDVAALLADFVPNPPPPTREALIAASTTLDELKAALLEGGG